MKKIIAKYRKRDFKLTPQRLAILKYLDGNTSHPTADDIFTNIKKAYPTVSFATVYNTLQALKEKGEILEVTIDYEKRHYDPNIAPHHHIICTECNKISDVFKDYSDSLMLPNEILKEFKTIRNHIDFYGICKECQKERGD
ncbi:MAG: transcriptional repressor [Nitrospinae bacterium RIFCSPLOWO2_12_39_16]|nr:MAG: transcriptional repressor [Nitrospinae bacterium RIFCSPLOWO2_12_39_16]